jgi:TPP-dependent pyruvate/acetoin dehydrogenase alpha subunit
VPGVRADGDDVLAVYAVVREAVEKAAKGGGPTLVELVGGGIENDPVARFVRYLEKKGIVTERAIADLTASAGEELDRAIDRASRGSGPSRESIVDEVYGETPWHLEEQRAAISRAPRAPER